MDLIDISKNFINSSDIRSITNQYRTNEYFDTIFEFKKIILKQSNHLNLDDESLFEFRLYLFLYLLFQFFCCLLLLLLNNWIYLSIWYDNKINRSFITKPTIRRTLSIENFMKKTEFKKNNSLALENVSDKNKLKNIDVNNMEEINLKNNYFIGNSDFLKIQTKISQLNVLKGSEEKHSIFTDSNLETSEFSLNRNCINKTYITNSNSSIFSFENSI